MKTRIRDRVKQIRLKAYLTLKNHTRMDTYTPEEIEDIIDAMVGFKNETPRTTLTPQSYTVEITSYLTHPLQNLTIVNDGDGIWKYPTSLQ